MNYFELTKQLIFEGKDKRVEEHLCNKTRLGLFY